MGMHLQNQGQSDRSVLHYYLFLGKPLYQNVYFLLFQWFLHKDCRQKTKRGPVIHTLPFKLERTKEELKPFLEI